MDKLSLACEDEGRLGLIIQLVYVASLNKSLLLLLVVVVVVLLL